MSSDVTARDRVWKAAVEQALDDPRKFRSRHVYVRMDDPPSHKTIQRVLRAMSELGVLHHIRGSPRYQRGPLLRD
jgi:hypothetical protein